MQVQLPNFITYAIPAFFLLIAVEVIYSWIKKAELYRLTDSLTDLSTGVLNRLATLFYLGLTVTIYSFFYDRFALIAWDLNTTRELWVSFTVGFVAFDFLYYWAHRMSHEMNFLWAGHVVHHQSEEFNLTVALRQPAFHQLFTWIFFLPLAILGIHPAVLVAIGEISLIYQFWIHTRTIKTLGPLEWILNTPSHHRVHHGRNPEYIDKNHAGTFIIWDMMFGTFVREKQEPVYGIVKPFRSLNPVWANLHYWQEIWHLMKRCPNTREKLLIWFRSPGYDPANPEARIVIPEVGEPDVRKSKPALAPVGGSSIYSVLWFALVSALVFGFLTFEDSLALPAFAILALWAGWSLVNTGGMLQNLGWWPASETIRLLCSAGLAYWVHLHPDSLEPMPGISWIAPAIYVVSSVSLVYSLRIKSDSEIRRGAAA